jgi:hypothetical protein
MFFAGKLGTFAKSQAISNWFGEDDTTGFVHSEGHTVHNGMGLERRPQDGHLRWALQRQRPERQT